MKIDQGVDGLFGCCDGGGSISGVFGVRISIPAKIIDKLLSMRWLDWPQAVIERETRLLLNENVDENIIAQMSVVVQEIAG